MTKFALLAVLVGVISGCADSTPIVEPSIAWDCLNLLCRFSAATEGEDPAEGYGFEWTFGDGNSASGRRVVHEYAREGDYVVVVQSSLYQRASAHASLAVQVSVSQVSASSPAFGAEGFPRVHTCHGDGSSPPLSLAVDGPVENRTLALLLRDQSAANATLWSWWDAPARSSMQVPAGATPSEATLGQPYDPPCAPPLEPTHELHLLVFLFRGETGLAAGSRASQLVEASRNDGLGIVELVASHQWTAV